MRARTLLWLTAILSSILGGVAVYLALSVPNDLKADAMLKSSRAQLAKGDVAGARTSLAKIVQQYPRTDAAAAAVVALSTIADEEREKLSRRIEQLESANAERAKTVDELQKSVNNVRTIQAATPKPAPVVAPKPAPAKKKATAPTRRRRR